MRLFIALNFPKSTVESLVRAQEALRRAAPRGNYSRRENLHLTLAFLGEQERGRLAAAEEAMDAARFSPLTLTFDRAGRFKNRGGDIWWLSCGEAPELMALQRRISAELASRGFTLEERRFVPHITLARQVILPPGAAAPALPESPVTAPAGRMSLMLSERIDGRLIYTELYHT